MIFDIIRNVMNKDIDNVIKNKDNSIINEFNYNYNYTNQFKNINYKYEFYGIEDLIKKYEKYNKSDNYDINQGFFNIEYDTEMFNKIIDNTVLNDKIKDRNEFLKYITNDYTSISGSSVLQIIQNQEYNNSDLDIYINMKKLNNTNIKNVIDFIVYLYKNYNNSKKIKTLQTLKKHAMYSLFYSRKQEYPKKYLSLRQYLKYYMPFKYNDKKIELIFINCDIKELLLKTFDYDFIKNYWTNGKMYTLNKYNIDKKIGYMTLNHYINRILLNKTEFINFINRYEKYTARGYKLYIHTTLLTKEIINYLSMIIYEKVRYNYQRQMVDNICPLVLIDIDNKQFNKNSHLVAYILLKGLFQRLNKKKD